VKWVVVATAVLLLLWVGVWIYFYIGLQGEQKAVAALKLNWPEVDYVSLLSRGKLYDLHTLPFTKPSAFERVVGLVLLDTRLTDLSPLADLPYLEMLHAEDTAVEDLSPLAALKRLDYLRVSGTRVRDISPLAGLPRLSDLDISDTAVRSIAPLTGKTSIHYLAMSGTPVTDFNPLATLVELYELKLDRTRITDTAPLMHLTHLSKLILPKETIDAAQAEALGKALRCKVERL
jgi:hypothetical protein